MTTEININKSGIDMSSVIKPEENKEEVQDVDITPEENKEPKQDVPQQPQIIEKPIYINDEKEKRQMLLIIDNYRLSRFGKYLKDKGIELNPSKLKLQSVEELKTTIADCRYYVNCKNSLNFVKAGTLGGLRLY